MSLCTQYYYMSVAVTVLYFLVEGLELKLLLLFTPPDVNAFVRIVPLLVRT